MPKLAPSLFRESFVYTDWFKSDGREESIDHKVDFFSQVRHTEVLQQSFLAAQTVDQHTEPQPTQTQTLSPVQNLKQDKSME